MGDNDNNDNESLSLSALGNEEYESLIHVFGGIEPDGQCSYKQGYVKRQSLYVCKTCTTSSPAAVCFNCIGICHENHEFEELHTKRLFRCDCGNEKFVTPCLLVENKDDLNEKNVYGHNFEGLYCSCNKEELDTMYQCTICEDWFHEPCLFPPNSIFLNHKKELDENEITCPSCMEKYPILKKFAKKFSIIYPNSSSSSSATSSSPSSSASSSTNNQKNVSQTLIKNINDLKENIEICCACEEEDEAKADGETKPITTTESENGAEPVAAEEPCAKRIRIEENSQPAAQIWLYSWRKKLCKCEKCQTLFTSLKLQFLLDEEDTLEHYDDLALKRVTQMEDEVIHDLLNDPDVVTRHTYAYAIGKLSNVIGEFCKKMAESGKTTQDNPVTDDDVKTFFDNLRSDKSD